MSNPSQKERTMLYQFLIVHEARKANAYVVAIHEHAAKMKLREEFDVPPDAEIILVGEHIKGVAVTEYSAVAGEARREESHPIMRVKPTKSKVITSQRLQRMKERL